MSLVFGGAQGSVVEGLSDLEPSPPGWVTRATATPAFHGTGVPGTTGRQPFGTTSPANCTRSEDAMHEAPPQKNTRTLPGYTPRFAKPEEQKPRAISHRCLNFEVGGGVRASIQVAAWSEDGSGSIHPHAGLVVADYIHGLLAELRALQAKAGAA